jgi:hypothetical protein
MPRNYRNQQQQRKTRTRRQRQRGGGVGMPSEYYSGVPSGAYVEQCGAVPYQTAYGMSVPHSFGTFDDRLGSQFAAPQLSPGGSFAGVATSSIQTGGGGGGRGRRRSSSRRRSTSRNSTSRNKRRQPTKSIRRRRRQRQPSRQQRGGGAGLPSEYYGGAPSGAYVEQCGRVPYQTAYGMSVPQSFGETTDYAPYGNASFAAPLLASGGVLAGAASSGLQTGGGGRRGRGHGRRSTRR